MTQKQEKNPTFTSPRGVFLFPHLVDPDYGTDEYPKKDGEYNVTLKLSAREAQPLIDQLESLHREAVAMGEEKFKELKPAIKKKLGELKVNDLFTEEYDKETEEPTGNLLFKFKTKASGVTKKGKPWERTLPIFDAKGTKFSPDSIWGGSEGRVSFAAAPYFVPGQGMAGVTFYLNAVQILELRAGGAASADAFGFGEEEGFEAEESTEKGDDSPFDTDDNVDF